MQVTCEGAVGIGTGERRLRRAERLRMTMCLYPMKAKNSTFVYHLDMYVIDIFEKGGGVDQRIGRAIGGAFVRKPGDLTNKTILDVLRRARRATATRITYI